MASIAFYDGYALFGSVVRCKHVPNANAAQVASYFGIRGTQSIDGGGRGRAFLIDGLWLAEATAELRGFETVLESYADGVPRVLVDTFGKAWDDVVYRGEYQPGELHFLAGGYALPFKCVFHGLY